MPLNKCFYLFVLTALSFNAFGQDNAKYNSLIPASPNAASIGKFGDVPVSKYTGIPNISIPIYSINLDGLEIPISLSYHSGGIKVEDEASWVGLNWALIAGGVINRTVRGKNDFAGDGFLNSPPMPDIVCDDGSPFTIDPVTGMRIYEQTASVNGFCSNISPFEAYSDYHTCKMLVDGQPRDYSNLSSYNIDWEPDVFYFNFLSYSGKFLFDKNYRSNKKIHFVEKAPLKIEIINDQGEPNSLTNPNTVVWLITDNNGFRYFFKEREYPQYGESAVSSWYLTKVVAPNNKEINLIYSSEAKPVAKRFYVQVYDNELPTSDFENISTSYSQLYLDSILFEEGYLIFDRAEGTREDLANAKKLERIKIYKNNDELLRQFSFEYSYYNPQKTEDFKRLKLNKVTEESGSLSRSWVLNYNTSIELPSKRSFAQDHWGFYNGKDQNSMLIPAYVGWSKSSIGNSFWVDFTGADRSVDPNFSSAGLLESIQYPTGGTTSFLFESNRYDDGEAQNQNPEDYEVKKYNATLIRSSSSPDIYTGDETFTVVEDLLSKNAVVRLSVRKSTGVTSGIGAAIKLQIVNVKTEQPEYTWSPDNTLNLDKTTSASLSPGEYKVRIFLESGAYDCFASITFEHRAAKPPFFRRNKPAGGVRIKKITTFDGVDINNNQVVEYVYGRVTNMNGMSVEISNGLLLSPPKYESISYQKSGVTTYSFLRQASSKIALGNGSSVGYEKVRELFGSGGINGSIVEDYFVQKDFFLNHPYRPSDLPTISNPRNGKLLAQTFLDKDGNVKKVIANNYVDADWVRIPAIRIIHLGSSSWSYINACGESMSFYTTTSQWTKLAGTKETIYIDNQPTLSTSVSYEYSIDQELRSRKTETSTGEIEEVNNLFASDLTVPLNPTGEALGIKMLQDKNMKSVVIESYSLLKKPTETSSKLIAGYITLYKQNNRNLNQVLPSKIFSVESSLPISSYILPSVTQNGLTLPTYYRLDATFDEYDEEGNITQRAKRNNIVESYIWNRKKKYPVAQIINASANQVAFTSFEDVLDNGGWVLTNTALLSDDGKLGSSSYTGNLSKSNLPEDNYRVSLWAKGSGTIAVNGILKTISNEWDLFEWDINLVTEIIITSNGNKIDEVRLLPKQSSMTTFSYEPLVGLRSQTDINNITTYYTYDKFSRLTSVQDDLKKLLKRIDYKYMIK